MTTIVATKLFVPRTRSTVVLRPRLIKQLNTGLDRKLTLISASAGFGKTTLLSEWIATCKRPVAWLSLNESDSDYTRFLSYFIAALQTVDATLGEKTLSLLQSPIPSEQSNQDSVLTTLINEIASSKQDFIFVLDDYHAIDVKEIDAALAFLIEHQPPQMHLVIATREDPQLPLSQLRVRAQLTELRANDLRFTPEESAEFLNQMMGLSLSAENIAALDTRTEGWIAGLQLAALSMQGQSEASNFIESFTGSNRFVLDYLLEEVLNQQSEELQDFLLQTSIVERLCAPLCNALLQESSSQDLLEFIEQANLFIIPLDNDRHWYRYHHLFGDLLRQRFLQDKALTKIQKNELHSRASDWYQENGFVVEAFEHAVSAEDLEKAAEWLELSQSQMDHDLQSATWLKMLKSLPDELIRSRAQLSVGYAWALLDSGEIEECDSRLQDAENATSSLSEEQRQGVLFSVATARAYQAQALGNLQDSVTYAEKAITLCSKEDPEQYAQAASMLGMNYWANGNLDLSFEKFTEFQHLMQKHGNFVFAVSVMIALAELRTIQGQLNEAINIYQDAINLAKAQGDAVIQVTANLHLGLSTLYFQQNIPQKAEESLEIAQNLSETFAMIDWNYRLHIFKAQRKESSGDFDEALVLLNTAEKVYVPTPMPNIQPVNALRARLLIKQNKLSDVQNWVQEKQLSINDELSYLQEFEHITLVRYLLADASNNKDIELALTFLNKLLEATELHQRKASQIELLILKALSYQKLGTELGDELWLEPLQQALTLAEPEGYIRIFSNEGSKIQQLLLKAQTHGNNSKYVSKILSVFEQTEQASTLINTLANDSLVEQLSKRELEVLQLIAQGLSNQDISDKLFRSLSTIKGHNRIIFAKLLVQNRTEAVAKARELGLL